MSVEVILESGGETPSGSAGVFWAGGGGNSERGEEEIKCIQQRILEAEWLQDHKLYSLCTKELEQLLLLRLARAQEDAHSGRALMCRMESEMERLVAHKSQAQGRCAAAAPKLLQAVQDLEDSRRECVALVHSLSGSLCRYASRI